VNKYENFRIQRIEDFLQKDSRDAIEYLDYIRQNYGEKKCIEHIKYAGYFVTDYYNYGFSVERYNEIQQWVNNTCSTETQSAFTRCCKEGKILSDKKSELENQIKTEISILKNNKFDSLQVLELVNAEVARVMDSNNMQIPEEYRLPTCENLILGTGVLIKFGLLKDIDNTYNKDVPQETILRLMRLAQVYNIFIDLIATWIFGDISIKKTIFGNITIKEKRGIITDRIISFEEYSALNNAKNTKVELLFSNSQDVVVRAALSMCEKVKEFFYSEDFTDVYIGFPLSDWIRIYLYFINFVLDKNQVVIVKESDLIEKLTKSGFDPNFVNLIIDMFSSNARNDLFSNFLIKNGGSFVIVPNIIKSTEPLKSIMCLFTNWHNSNIEDRGEYFEKYIYSLVSGSTKTNSIITKLGSSHKLKGTGNKDSYELDVLMYMDNTLFILECKTQFQHENLRDYYRNIGELDVYLKKFRRNADYFTKEHSGIESLYSRFREKNVTFDIEKTRVVLVFVGNITYPFVKQDDIYIIDSVKLYNYFCKQPYMVRLYEAIKKDNGYLECVEKSAFSLLPQELYDEDINAKSFEKFLLNSRNYVIDTSKSIRCTSLKELKNYGLNVKRFQFSQSKYQRIVNNYIRNHNL